ncbi:16S rRNA (uracil(1498)-N(3))-methyltransferase [Propionispora hippei]|uniref:Ribosomal RNA small subunit methyltransferase E n=1 Tax=Propionispora hippei DSM 15287 TaxID=1123003 RepID=A0A1M6AM06_9FIRM|nr:16S rRNA (uracil(1498)-N(3))-methyltransferase [Propionispora hippei]SHI37368.1 16S rRNA (uracil1498-N3)-methyltransferase [Propionispora hippei DSM 15287]
MRRFFLKGKLGAAVTITGPDAYHMSRVLRMKPGERVTLIAEDGQAVIAVIQQVEEYRIRLCPEEIIKEEKESPVRVSLAQCLPKSDKMDYIVQKAVELGADSIIPVISQNTVVRYDAKKKAERVSRWQKIAAEAAKQSGRLQVPVVEAVQDLDQLFQHIDKESKVLLLYEGQADTTLKQVLRQEDSLRYTIIVGPEGGFTPDEVQLCRSLGALVITLGPRILRTETAPVAALSIVMYECGDMGGD